MPPLTEEEKEVLNKEREEKAKKKKEERKIKEEKWKKREKEFSSKCWSFFWKVIKAQLSLIFLGAFGFFIWLLFFPA
jgi:cytoskeletal protein RodZ